jgi:hypothetical protein
VLIHSKPCRFDLTRLHVTILFYYPREGHLRLHQWSLQFTSSYSIGRCQPQHWNLRQFLSTQSIRWNCQTERVKWWTQHDRTLQRALSPTHGRNNYMGDREYPLLDYLDSLWSPWLMHPSSFSCDATPFVNRGTIFLLKGDLWRPTLKQGWSVLTRIITGCHYWSNDA